jgi:myosin tail region-interacting protein MTI1
MATAPFRVKAIYEYSSPHDDDLSFPNGQIITVTEEEDDDWYSGEYVDSSGQKHEGIFPRNFVEKYEPEIPSRPVRPARAKKEAETTAEASVAAKPQDVPAQAQPVSQEPVTLPETLAQASSPPIGTAKSPPVQLPARQPLPTPSKLAEKQQGPPPTKAPPPEASDKPSGGSFKDRIAAFNKPAAPPIAPFKPGGQGGSSTGFIKKPFVAPPPSKNAYVPPPREPPLQRVYRREEDPALHETAEDSESSMPLPGETAEAGEEDKSKPTSLKDRIALLQKQQLEQAARHAEAAQKKEKPKRPPKKRTDSQEPVETEETPVEGGLQRRDTSDTMGKKSVDFADDESGPLRGPSGRQASTTAHMSTPPPPSRELMSDTNDADYSAAGDTEEAYDTSTSKEDDRDKRRGKQKGAEDLGQPKTGRRHEESGEEAEEEDEEEEIDPEIKRRMEIRERMAKMSGGMGLMGMFGPPGGTPTPGKKPRTSVDVERDVAASHVQQEATERAPPIPVPGMSNVRSSERQAPQEEQESSADETPDHISSVDRQIEAEESDKEAPEPPRPPQRASTDRAPPAAPESMSCLIVRSEIH